jgi:hypothetical protein
VASAEWSGPGSQRSNNTPEEFKLKICKYAQTCFGVLWFLRPWGLKLRSSEMRHHVVWQLPPTSVLFLKMEAPDSPETLITRSVFRTGRSQNAQWTEQTRVRSVWVITRPYLGLISLPPFHTAAATTAPRPVSDPGNRDLNTLLDRFRFHVCEFIFMAEEPI